MKLNFCQQISVYHCVFVLTGKLIWLKIVTPYVPLS